VAAEWRAPTSSSRPSATDAIDAVGMRIFFQDAVGSLGEPVDRASVPRVGDRVWVHLDEYTVLAVSWWMWGEDTVSLLVERARSA
jgi:hypothetical protein